MGCGASAGKEKTAGSYDPLEAAKDTWFDPTEKYAPLDKVHVKITGDISNEELGTLEIKVEIPGGATENACKWQFGKNNYDRYVLLLQKRGQGTKLEFTYGGGWFRAEETATAKIPEASQGWVELPDLLDKEKGLGVSILAEPAETKLCTKEELDACGLESIDIPIEGEDDVGFKAAKAVLTYKLKEGNTKLLFWLPGRNDTFGHANVVQPLLDIGYDLYVMEHRRLGRSQKDADSETFKYCSHTGNFRLYLEEFEKGMDRALNSMGKSYEKVVLYGFSTGGLEATLLLREGKYRDRFCGVVFNSPFLDWGGQSSLMEVALDTSDEWFPVMELIKGKEGAEITALVDPGGKPSAFNARIWSQYPAVDLRCTNMFTNKLTLGWAKAASAMHDELKCKEPKDHGDLPLLLMTTNGDIILDHSELPALVKKHVSSKAECVHLADRRHDLFRGFNKEQNEEALQILLRFLSTV